MGGLGTGIYYGGGTAKGVGTGILGAQKGTIYNVHVHHLVTYRYITCHVCIHVHFMSLHMYMYMYV